MTKAQVSAFLSAVEDAEIKNFEVVNDISSHFYNTDTAIVKVNDSKECFVAVRNTSRNASLKPYSLEATVVDYIDMHEARVYGTAKQINAFMESIGSSLSEDEYKILLQIDGNNYSLNPETGDYNNTFTYLSPKQYAALSQEDKETYDSEKEAFEKEKETKLAAGQSASISYY